MNRAELVEEVAKVTCSKKEADAAVSATLAAFTTMTKSPVSMWGAYCALCFPRNRVAAVTANRPSTTSWASITCHFLVTSPGFGLYVDTVTVLLP